MTCGPVPPSLWRRKMNSYRNDNSRTDLDPGASQIAHMLNELAGQIQPDPAFASNLERRLISTYSGRNATSHLSFKRLAPALIWVLVIGLMAVVLDWAIRSLAPEPVPAARSTSSPTLSVPMPPVDQRPPLPSGESYEWRGTTLYLAAALPDAPSEASVYRAQLAQHATAEDAMALAQRFGIQGNIYLTTEEPPDEKDYLITDGKRSLSVGSSQYFTYTADIVQAYNYFGTVTNPDAEPI